MPVASQLDKLPPGIVKLPNVLDLKSATPLAVEFLALPLPRFSGSVVNVCKCFFPPR
jgi:hypothetical protein